MTGKYARMNVGFFSESLSSVAYNKGRIVFPGLRLEKAVSKLFCLLLIIMKH